MNHQKSLISYCDIFSEKKIKSARARQLNTLTEAMLSVEGDIEGKTRGY